MSLAEAVTASDESDGLFVVHRHAGKGFADVTRGRDGVGIAIGAFRVDVDQTHLNGGKRVGQLAVTAVALIAEPGSLRAPIDVLLRLPNVCAAAAEAEGLEAHGIEGHVAGEDHEVRPGDFAAVLLLDGPEPRPPPPRPSWMRYVPAECQAMRMKSGP